MPRIQNKGKLPADGFPGTPHRQGKPLLAISREALPRIQNKVKILAGRFPGMAPDRKLLLGPRSPVHGLVQGVPGLPVDVPGDWVELQHPAL